MMKRKQITATALVEFALIIPIFLILLSGVIEISFLLYDKTIITDASRDGARYGVMLRSGGYANEDAIKTYTENYCANKLITFGGSPSVTVTATPSNPTPTFGDTLTVVVSYQYTGLLLYTLINSGQQVNLTASTVMSYE